MAGDWDENLVCWNNTKFDNSTIVSRYNISKDSGWIDFDVTTSINEMISGNLINNGFYLSAFIDAEKIIKLYSKDFTNPSFYPRLILTNNVTGSYDEKTSAKKVPCMKDLLFISSRGIDFSSAVSAKYLSIFSPKGRFIDKFEITPTTSRIDFNNQLAQGVYILYLYVPNNNKKVYRFLVTE